APVRLGWAGGAPLRLLGLAPTAEARVRVRGVDSGVLLPHLRRKESREEEVGQARELPAGDVERTDGEVVVAPKIDVVLFGPPLLRRHIEVFPLGVLPGRRVHDVLDPGPALEVLVRNPGLE